MKLQTHTVAKEHPFLNQFDDCIPRILYRNRLLSGNQRKFYPIDDLIDQIEDESIEVLLYALD